MENLVRADRNQACLLPPDSREWLPEDDLAHFVVEAVERVPLSQFQLNTRGTGSAQYPSRMMPALLIYCYANSVFFSRRIERATYRDIGVRYVMANTHPDHGTICKFRCENLEAVQSGFADGVGAPGESGLTVGCGVCTPGASGQDPGAGRPGRPGWWRCRTSCNWPEGRQRLSAGPPWWVDWGRNTPIVHINTGKLRVITPCRKEKA